ncbi:MAG: DUF1294 domain-containing protein [Luteolibacter sp.]|jgi:uncharacterized membrane protein YsdA (DUF1294 family)/cold shock CspA family protein|nr:DUF1294 domain-containing protein [Luteolibacter sp.]
MRDEPFQKSQSSSPQVGKIVKWEDGKGFGWIETGGARVFAHIKDFKRGQHRPQVGEEVRFIAGVDAQGRNCAKQTIFVKSRGRVGIGSCLLLCGLLVLPLLAMLWLPVAWWMGAGAMTLVSAITYRIYADDKQRAVNSGWRVPESTLHVAELLGGWPGAFIAQRLLRHKCSKLSYQVVFWGIVMLFQYVAADVILEQKLSRAVMKAVIAVFMELPLQFSPSP